MNFPAIAKKTYESLKGQIAFASISQFVIDHLKKMSSPLERANFVHNVVDDYNREVLAHPIVFNLSPCKEGCSGCCHTQVSVTEDEAELLISRIAKDVKINYAALAIQAQAGNDADEFYKLSFEERKCVFLGSNNTCQVYNDRPSVCRTNTVLGEASQCSTEDDKIEKQVIRLVRTPKADMAIMGSFLTSKDSGALANMLSARLLKNNKKSIFINRDL
ncbi:MAG: YkgJ family cysteine cluster protein [Alphaproteobacteria bacterium]|nr:MAG: YkgJ family cysteine cluster protein [Alphaproteobacteria bacterium]